MTPLQKAPPLLPQLSDQSVLSYSNRRHYLKLPSRWRYCTLQVAGMSDAQVAFVWKILVRRLMRIDGLKIAEGSSRAIETFRGFPAEYTDDGLRYLFICDTIHSPIFFTRGAMLHKSHGDPSDPDDVISIRLLKETGSRVDSVHVYKDGSVTSKRK